MWCWTSPANPPARSSGNRAAAGLTASTRAVRGWAWRGGQGWPPLCGRWRSCPRLWHQGTGVHGGRKPAKPGGGAVGVGDWPLAIGGQRPPLEHLASHGRRLPGSEAVCRDHHDCRHDLQRSRGEFSEAQHLYVATRSDWFSCRSVRYLAAGRPVVPQDAGVSRGLAAGGGADCQPLACADLARSSTPRSKTARSAPPRTALPTLSISAGRVSTGPDRRPPALPPRPG